MARTVFARRADSYYVKDKYIQWCLNNPYMEPVHLTQFLSTLMLTDRETTRFSSEGLFARYKAFHSKFDPDLPVTDEAFQEELKEIQGITRKQTGLRVVYTLDYPKMRSCLVNSCSYSPVMGVKA